MESSSLMSEIKETMCRRRSRSSSSELERISRRKTDEVKRLLKAEVNDEVKKEGLPTSSALLPLFNAEVEEMAKELEKKSLAVREILGKPKESDGGERAMSPWRQRSRSKSGTRSRSCSCSRSRSRSRPRHLSRPQTRSRSKERPGSRSAKKTSRSRKASRSRSPARTQARSRSHSRSRHYRESRNMRRRRDRSEEDNWRSSLERSPHLRPKSRLNKGSGHESKVEQHPDEECPEKPEAEPKKNQDSMVLDKKTLMYQKLRKMRLGENLVAPLPQPIQADYTISQHARPPAAIEEPAEPGEMVQQEEDHFDVDSPNEPPPGLEEAPIDELSKSTDQPSAPEKVEEETAKEEDRIQKRSEDDEVIQVNDGQEDNPMEEPTEPADPDEPLQSSADELSDAHEERLGRSPTPRTPASPEPGSSTMVSPSTQYYNGSSEVYSYGLERELNDQTPRREDDNPTVEQDSSNPLNLQNFSGSPAYGHSDENEIGGVVSAEKPRSSAISEPGDCNLESEISNDSSDEDAISDDEPNESEDGENDDKRPQEPSGLEKLEEFVENPLAENPPPVDEPADQNLKLETSHDKVASDEDDEENVVDRPHERPDLEELEDDVQHRPLMAPEELCDQNLEPKSTHEQVLPEDDSMDPEVEENIAVLPRSDFEDVEELVDNLQLEPVTDEVPKEQADQPPEDEPTSSEKRLDSVDDSRNSLQELPADEVPKEQVNQPVDKPISAIRMISLVHLLHEPAIDEVSKEHVDGPEDEPTSSKRIHVLNEVWLAAHRSDDHSDDSRCSSVLSNDSGYVLTASSNRSSPIPFLQSVSELRSSSSSNRISPTTIESNGRNTVCTNTSSDVERVKRQMEAQEISDETAFRELQRIVKRKTRSVRVASSIRLLRRGLPKEPSDKPMKSHEESDKEMEPVKGERGLPSTLSGQEGRQEASSDGPMESHEESDKGTESVMGIPTVPARKRKYNGPAVKGKKRRALTPSDDEIDDFESPKKRKGAPKRAWGGRKRDSSFYVYSRPRGDSEDAIASRTRQRNPKPPPTYTEEELTAALEESQSRLREARPLHREVPATSSDHSPHWDDSQAI